jgi:archaellum component FlaC
MMTYQAELLHGRCNDLENRVSLLEKERRHSLNPQTQDDEDDGPLATLRRTVLEVDLDINRRIDNLDKKIEKRFDSVDKRFDGVNKKIDGVEHRLDTKIDDVRAEMAGGFTSVNAAIGELREGMDEILTRLPSAPAGGTKGKPDA